MSLIICMTGPIDSGKSQFCNLLRSLEPSSIGFESGELITEIANECNGYLLAESKGLTEGDNFFSAFNNALSKLEQNHPQLFSEEIDINFSASDLLEYPEQFEMLQQYLEVVRMRPDILSLRITEDSKDLYFRPFLKWLGGYMVFKVSPTIWFDEIGRRILRFKPAPEIITVNALRYPTDESAMRTFAQTNGYECIVIEMQRPGTSEGDDVTEASRNEIHADSIVINNGSISDLAKTAQKVLHDHSKGRLKPEYRAH